MSEQFTKHIQEGYTFKGKSLYLGAAKLNDEVLADAEIKVPLKMFNRHGLIAGATGTGKTKTLQLIAEGLSHEGVSCLLMDVKGDLSGLAQPGDEENKHIVSRHEKLGKPYTANGFPVELLSLSDENGVKLKATVSEFGPVLFSKILDLSESQSGIVSIIFKYCDDKKLPLIDLKDMRKVLQFVSDEGKEEIEEHYGRISSTSVGTIMRKIVALEQEGAETFFGEPSFDTEDLLRKDADGKGFLNIIRLVDIQTKPHLFSTFMLSLLSEVYNTFPEQGDADKPKLVIFIDEAHLIFKEASKELLQQLDSVIKLIRSKGVGIFFITQVPGDIPDNILSQLGLKVQHALRAFTAKDRKEIKLVSENYPLTDFYDVDELLTSLGIGEAIVTGLNEKGIPTPLAHTYLRAPESRMDILTKKELKELIENSELIEEYNQEIDRNSAYEILSKKLEDATDDEEEVKTKRRSKRDKEEPSTFDKVLKSPVVRSVGVAVAGAITRSILGSLGLKTTRRSYRRKKKTSWF